MASGDFFIAFWCFIPPFMIIFTGLFLLITRKLHFHSKKSSEMIVIISHNPSLNIPKQIPRLVYSKHQNMPFKIKEKPNKENEIYAIPKRKKEKQNNNLPPTPISKTFQEDLEAPPLPPRNIKMTGKHKQRKRILEKNEEINIKTIENEEGIKKKPSMKEVSNYFRKKKVETKQTIKNYKENKEKIKKEKEDSKNQNGDLKEVKKKLKAKVKQLKRESRIKVEDIKEEKIVVAMITEEYTNAQVNKFERRHTEEQTVVLCFSSDESSEDDDNEAEEYYEESDGSYVELEEPYTEEPFEQTEEVFEQPEKNFQALYTEVSDISDPPDKIYEQMQETFQPYTEVIFKEAETIGKVADEIYEEPIDHINDNQGMFEEVYENIDLREDIQQKKDENNINNNDYSNKENNDNKNNKLKNIFAKNAQTVIAIHHFAAKEKQKIALRKQEENNEEIYNSGNETETTDLEGSITNSENSSVDDKNELQM